jgi:antitoxin component YwqK of YwqJK toxin-antitoxin module
MNGEFFSYHKNKALAYKAYFKKGIVLGEEINYNKEGVKVTLVNAK